MKMKESVKRLQTRVKTSRQSFEIDSANLSFSYESVVLARVMEYDV